MERLDGTLHVAVYGAEKYKNASRKSSVMYALTSGATRAMLGQREFCVALRFGRKQTQQTRRYKAVDGRSAGWNESFEIDVTEDDPPQIEIFLMDFTQGKIVGSVRVRFDKMALEKRVVDQPLVVTRKSGNATIESGTVHVRLKFEFAKEPGKKREAKKEKKEEEEEAGEVDGGGKKSTKARVEELLLIEGFDDAVSLAPAPSVSAAFAQPSLQSSVSAPVPGLPLEPVRERSSSLPGTEVLLPTSSNYSAAGDNPFADPPAGHAPLSPQNPFDSPLASAPSAPPALASALSTAPGLQPALSAPPAQPYNPFA
eukprot:tig00022099_g23809.t1